MNTLNKLVGEIAKSLIMELPDAGPCHICGSTDTTRALGPDNQPICGPCASKYPHLVLPQMDKLVADKIEAIKEARKDTVAGVLQKLQNFRDAGAETIMIIQVRFMTTDGRDYTMEGMDPQPMSEEAMERALRTINSRMQ